MDEGDNADNQGAKDGEVHEKLLELALYPVFKLLKSVLLILVGSFQDFDL